MTKRCTRCRIVKSFDEFGDRPKSKDGRKKCYSTYNAARLRECQKADPLYNRRKNLALNYDLTLAEFDAMFEKQRGVCAICGQPETATWNGMLRYLCVDHSHATGQVRGLLCSSCNQAIGLMAEAPLRFAAAAKYLTERGE